MRRSSTSRGPVGRRLLVAGLVSVAVLAAAVPVAVALHLRDDGPSRKEYLAQVESICNAYGRKLDEISPPNDLSSPGAVYESLGLALPVLREQAATVRALPRPDEMEKELNEFFALTDKSIVRLQRARNEAGERALFPMAVALTDFERVRDEAQQVAKRIGFRCAS